MNFASSIGLGLSTAHIVPSFEHIFELPKITRLLLRQVSIRSSVVFLIFVFSVFPLKNILSSRDIVKTFV